VESDDPAVNAAVQIIRQAARKTVEQAGDGTTTSIVLTYEILNRLNAMLNEGSDMLELKWALGEELKLCVDFIRSKSHKLVTGGALDLKKVQEIAAISANNDDSIGKLFYEAYETMGPDGIVMLDKSRRPDSWVEAFRGMKVDRGFEKEDFCNRGSFVFHEKAAVYVTDKVISQQKDIIKIIKTPTNGGTAKARNCGIQAAKGDFFAFLDADDVYYPEKVAYSMFKMTEFPTVGLVYSDYDEYNINGNNQIIRQYKEPFSFQNLLNRCIVSTNPVIAKQAFMSVGLYNENIKGMEDYELALRIGSKHTMVHVPIALFKYNNHGKNKTLTTPKEAWAKEEQLMKQNFIRMMQNGPAKR
jgi:glycosyltransferase involved in cell wall biosynthesis